MLYNYKISLINGSLSQQKKNIQDSCHFVKKSVFSCFEIGKLTN